ncbi:pentapeptide repeat family protein [Nostoc commune NIES-4072]|uniref:Pentapeptide repeat family protein n=1 Tax=Nostoc commune NIES-4072 TaxID=2005467 RepID=A0A2R5G1S8_NOSCO|nr:pentapeptide repeat family protein [Nostoc commune HK-02]GBG23678.1 pentapeptide repeat family protein [Nostoc commune NIES-4072]
MSINAEELLSFYAAGRRNFATATIEDKREGFFRGVDLSGINLKGCFIDIDFSGATMRNAIFSYVKWELVVWEDIDFSGSDFTGVKGITGSTFINCNFRDTIWDGANLWQPAFVECTFPHFDSFKNVRVPEIHFLTKSQYFGY